MYFKIRKSAPAQAICEKLYIMHLTKALSCCEHFTDKKQKQTC